MTTEKIAIKFFEAYMTNVCNFNCPNCNRLNNYKFAGHFKWQDVEADYQRWSEKLEPSFINILGGEPFLNLDLPNWIIGLRKLWPRADIYLLSNGSCLHFQKDVYSLLKDNNILLDIGLHNRERCNESIKQIKNLLVQPITETFTAKMELWPPLYNSKKPPEWPSANTWKDFFNFPEAIQKECTEVYQLSPIDWRLSAGTIVLKDANNVTVTIGYSEYFYTAPLKYNGEDKFVTYNSDPAAAHRVCISKYCAEMVDGKLYKCHHVALLPKFMKQYQTDISDEDRDLLLNYQPLLSTASKDETEKFLAEIKNPIPQCKLCPDKLNREKFSAGTNKPKIKKIIQIRTEDFGNHND